MEPLYARGSEDDSYPGPMGWAALMQAIGCWSKGLPFYTYALNHPGWGLNRQLGKLGYRR